MQIALEAACKVAPSYHYQSGCIISNIYFAYFKSTMQLNSSISSAINKNYMFHLFHHVSLGILYELFQYYYLPLYSPFLFFQLHSYVCMILIKNKKVSPIFQSLEITFSKFSSFFLRVIFTTNCFHDLSLTYRLVYYLFVRVRVRVHLCYYCMSINVIVFGSLMFALLR